MNKKNKGQVVFVNLYDNRYWNVFLDGELFHEIHKKDFTHYILKESNRKALANAASIKESELNYSCIDLENGIDEVNYNSNDYQEFKEVLIACDLYNIEYTFKNVNYEYIANKY